MSLNGGAPANGRGPRVLIIGAGPGGLCMGIKLREAGFERFVILDEADGVGGTWRHNQYPGLACDVPSLLYSFSFEHKKDWTRPYAAQPEILAYLEQCVAKYGLEPRLRLGTGVRGAYWDDECMVWRVVTEHGEELVADVVVSGMGMFNELNWPDIPGLDSFPGTVFHSARWPREDHLTGRAVGVIGTAASAVQFIAPVAKQARSSPHLPAVAAVGAPEGPTHRSTTRRSRGCGPTRSQPGRRGGRSGGPSRASQWPHTMTEFRSRTLRPDPEAYVVQPGSALV